MNTIISQVSSCLNGLIELKTENARQIKSCIFFKWINKNPYKSAFSVRNPCHQRSKGKKPLNTRSNTNKEFNSNLVHPEILSERKSGIKES